MSEISTTVTTVFSLSYGAKKLVHAQCDASPGFQQSWCGVRAQLRHSVYVGKQEDVTCPRCLSALAKGQPQAFRSRG